MEGVDATTHLTVVVPAFNEARYLPETLTSIRRAADHLRETAGVDVEVIVVDNNSTDETAEVAGDMGATVVHEPVQGIGRARNRGASAARGDVLVFVDADVFVPEELLEAVYEAMSDPACIGGGAEVEYRPQRRVMRAYLRCWRQLARLTSMVQGPTQFCRRGVFESVGGYDERVWIGEDVDFFWSLKKLARRTRRMVRIVRSPRVDAFDEALRQDAGLEGAAVHQSPLHCAAPPVEGGVGGLVRATRAVGRGRAHMREQAGLGQGAQPQPGA